MPDHAGNAYGNNPVVKSDELSVLDSLSNFWDRLEKVGVGLQAVLERVEEPSPQSAQGLPSIQPAAPPPRNAVFLMNRIRGAIMVIERQAERIARAIG